MLELIKSPYLNLLVSISGVTVAILIAALAVRRQKKSLSYEVQSDIPLLTQDEELAGDVQILFRSKAVPDIYLMKLKIMNTGGAPIPISDYVSPISITVGKKAEVLTAAVLGTSPSNLWQDLSGKCTHDKKTITLEPVLLNSGDSITIKALVSQLGRIGADARIVGLNRMEKLIESHGLFRAAFFGLGFAFLSLIGVIWSSGKLESIFLTLAFMGFLTFIFCLILMTLRSAEFRWMYLRYLKRTSRNS